MNVAPGRERGSSTPRSASPAPRSSTRRPTRSTSSRTSPSTTAGGTDVVSSSSTRSTWARARTSSAGRSPSRRPSRAPGRGASTARSPTRRRSRTSGSALLLSNGVVYVASASYGDIGPYHGWVLGYNAHTLKQVSAFNDTPNGLECSWGGIWMSGGGPAADAAGNIYFTTGNGTVVNPGPDGGDYGDSVVKLAADGKTVLDSFTPYNQAYLDSNDLDFGSGGIMLLPDQPGAGPPPGGHRGQGRDDLPAQPRQPGQVHRHHDLVSSRSPARSLLVRHAGLLERHTSTTAAGSRKTSRTRQATARRSRRSRSSTASSTRRRSSAPGTYDWPGGNPVVSANGATNGIVWAVSGTDRQRQRRAPGPPRLRRLEHLPRALQQRPGRHPRRRRASTSSSPPPRSPTARSTSPAGGR